MSKDVHYSTVYNGQNQEMPYHVIIENGLNELRHI